MKKWDLSQHPKKKSLCWIYNFETSQIANFKNASYNGSMNKLLLTFIVSVFLVTNAVAAEDQTSGPDIRILTDKHQTIEEYRSHGRLYMIKITPKKGRPYYLVDADGDGDMETRKNDLSPNLMIPSWVLFSW